MPMSIYEEYDIIYMNQYDSLMVSDSGKNFWNPFQRDELRSNHKYEENEIIYPKNITFKEVFIGNLFHDVSLLNISYYTDADPDQRFRKLFTSAIVYKNQVYNVKQRMQCYDYLVFKVETSEGFHTKTFNCEEMTFSETFVTRMSSLVS